MKTPKTPNDFLWAAQKEHKDIETENGFLCATCFEGLWYRGEYTGTKIIGLTPQSDNCYNCHPDKTHRHSFPIDSDICACGFERVWEGTIYDQSR